MAVYFYHQAPQVETKMELKERKKLDSMDTSYSLKLSHFYTIHFYASLWKLLSCIIYIQFLNLHITSTCIMMYDSILFLIKFSRIMLIFLPVKNSRSKLKSGGWGWQGACLAQLSLRDDLQKHYFENKNALRCILVATF